MSEAAWYKTCLRCGGEMEEGFALDETHGGVKQSRWISGPPRKSIWTGLKLGGKRKLPISAYRCMNCGFLDLYANEKD
ncbi:MAG: PF20097 family protein [Rubricoccaceae bacterium]|nr:PF20097 family protein [Rubricoccaceae bacterium]